MRVLLTGFEPFGGESINPSWEIARRIGGDLPDRMTIETALLPVHPHRVKTMLREAIERSAPDVVLGLGQAGGRFQLTPERVAINVVVYTEQDAAREEPIVETGPAAYFSTMPVKELVQAILGAGVPASLSNSAGTYICNEMLYLTLHTLAERGLAIPAGFIHVPYLPEQVLTKKATPSMALDTMVRGVTAALQCIADARDTRQLVRAGTTP